MAADRRPKPTERDMLGKVLRKLIIAVAGVVLLVFAALVYLNSDHGRERVAGYIESRYGHEVAFDGVARIGFSPLSVSLANLAVAVPGEEPWLTIERATLTAPRALLDPSAEDPVVVALSGASLAAGRLPGRRGGERRQTWLPFPVEIAVDQSVIEGLPGDRAALDIESMNLRADLASGARFSLRAALGGEPVASELLAGFGDPVADSSSARVSGWIDFAGLTLAVHGDVADWPALGGVDLQLTAAGDIAGQAGVGAQFFDERVKGRLFGDVGALTFEMSEMAATTAHGGFGLSATIRQERRRLVMEHGDLEVEASDLAAFLGDFGFDAGVTLPARLSARLDGDYDGVNVEHFTVVIGDGDVELAGSGRFARDEAGGGDRVEDVRFTIDADDIAIIISAFGVDSRLTGPLTGSAVADGPLHRILVERLQLDLGAGALTATGEGVLARSDHGMSLELAASVRGTDIARVVPKVPMAEWFGERGEASGTLRFAERQFSLAGLVALFESERGRARVSGDIQRLRDLASSGIEVVLDAAPASAPAGIVALDLALDLPEGLDAGAAVEANGAAARGRFEFEGTIAEPRRLAGIAGEFRFEPDPSLLRGVEAPGAAAFAGRVEAGALDEREFELSARLVGSDGTISYSGRLDEDFGGSGQLRLKDMDANAMTALAGATTAFPNPVDLVGSLRHDASGIYLEGLDLASGETRIQGSVDVRFPGSNDELPHVRVDATAPDLHLADLGLDTAPDAETTAEAASRTSYFSTAPLSLKSLATFDLDLDLDVGTLHSKAIDYQSVSFRGQGRGGVVEIASTQRMLGGGESSLELHIDSSAARPAVSVNVLLDGIDPGRLRALEDSGDEYSGDIDVEIEIAGHGDSVHEIMSGADGHLLVRINSAVLPNRQLNLLSADVLFEVFRIVNPFDRQARNMEIECGVVGFVVRGGKAVADKSIVIKGSRLLIIGEGEIDLGSERLALVMRPKAQEGIGLSTSGLVKFIGVGGTLSAPEYRTDPKGLLMTGASIGAAVASGGMSLLLQNMFDRLTTGGKECARVEAAFRDSLAGSAKAGREPQRESVHPPSR